MAHEHPSGIAGAYSRVPGNPDWTGVVVREDKLAQGAEINEVQDIIERRHRRVAGLVVSDGDRVSGGDAVVDRETGTVRLAAGQVYARGDVRSIGAVDLLNVPMVGEVIVGIRIATRIITELDDPSLKGLHPGTEAEGEAGAARTAESSAWGRSGDGEAGDLISVYLLRDGTVIDQTPPPSLSGITQAIALYDRQAHGNYIVEGCRVTALGKTGGYQQFSIEEGIANIWGFKTTRYASLRYAEIETYDLRSAQSEPHVFADGGTGMAEIALNFAPLAAVATAIITKEVTETKTRGTPNNTADLLDHDSVTAIVEVKRGATTYTAGTDYTLSGNYISWAPLGAEPAGGESYTVKYRYLAPVVPTATSSKSVTLTGGVTGTSVFLTYDWKLPRIDRLCLDQNGLPVYVRGLSARTRPAAPAIAGDLLALCTITNNWIDKPEVVNDGTRSVHFDEQWRYFNRLFDMIDLVALEKQKRAIDTKDPVAKKGVFADPLTSDYYRDAGAPQTAAVFNGSCQLAIDPTFYTVMLTGPVTLDWTEEVVIRQELSTTCVLINPYQNFNPLPAQMTITPVADFWTEHATQWTSPATQQFGSGNLSRTTVQNVLVDQRQQQIEFLRQIPIAFTVKGFGVGEILTKLTFDGVDVTPAGPLVGNASGVVAGTFTIPAGVTAGQKVVAATGASGATAAAAFVGQGTIDIDVMRRVTTIVRSASVQTTERPTSGVDPQAQTYTLSEGRHIAGVDLKFCARGNPAKECILEVRTVENGWPTGEVVMAQRIDMATIVLNAWTAVRFAIPLFQPADREFVFVVKTDDNEHSIGAATLTQYDAANQAWVSAQPYTVGVRLSSSNASTWTAHQDSDLTFRVVAAKFGPATKVVDLGAHALVDCSDLMVRGVVELPTADASQYFEVERASGEIIKLQPDQVYEFTEYVTETVHLRAVLKGSQKVSPILFPAIQLIAGKIRASGTYITRAMAMGTNVRLTTILATRLPAGSTLKVEHDGGNGIWTEATLAAQTPLNDGWVEREYVKNPYTAAEGRLRVTQNGGPAARPAFADPRSWSV